MTPTSRPTRSGADTPAHGIPKAATRARLATALLIAVLAAGIACAQAAADGDPASDILLGAPVFFPYSSPVSSALQKQLTTEAKATGRTGFPIKVALIDSPMDLGADPSLYGQPQHYAEFLDQEINFLGNPHPPLLVVMADGYGTAGLPAAAASAASALAKPGAGRSDGLARAAIRALPKLAAAAGHPIPAGLAASGSGSGGSDSRPLLIVLVAVVAIAAAGMVLVTRRRLAGRG